MTIEAVSLQEILPHRFPFLLLDRVLELQEGERILARKCVSLADPILQGHFPGRPIFPGVLQVEAMAQAAVVLAGRSGYFDPATHNCLFIGIQQAKFRGPVIPGDVLEIEVRALRLGRIGKFAGEIRCDGDIRSSAGFTAMIEARG